MSDRPGTSDAPDPSGAARGHGVDEAPETLSSGYPEEAWEGAGRPLFLHPPWTVGVVLVFAVVALLLGLGGHPVWLLIGSPFILVLAVWLWARIAMWTRGGGDTASRRR